jgi:DNA mismatch repair protein MutS
VARLAGLPEAAPARAQEILARLEAGEGAQALARLAEELPLFAPPRPQPPPSAVEAALARVDPDRLTPREALEALYRLKSLGDE